MNSPSKPPLSEEPATQLVSHVSEETPTQPSPTSDSPSEETELQPNLTPEPLTEEHEQQSASSPEPVAEGNEQQLTPSSEPVAAESELQSVDPISESSNEENIPTEAAPSSEPSEISNEEDMPTEAALSSESLTEDTESEPVSSEPITDDASSTSDEVEVFDLDEDADENEAFEEEQPGSRLFQPMQSGLFIHTKALIAAVCAIVVIALVVVVFLFVTRPKDPPTDWIASYTAPGSPSSSKTLYYLHWTNENGNLTGQLQLAANPSGTPQSLTATATGLYNRDNHIIYVVVIVQGQPDTLTGKINDNNDTMTLTLAGATSTDGLLVFHLGNANDYKKATQQLGPKKK
jgi:hypothetical protein